MDTLMRLNYWVNVRMDEDNNDTVQSQKYLSTLQVSRYCLFGFAEQYATVLYLRHAKFSKQHWEYWPEPIRLWENDKQLCIAPWSKHDTALLISNYNVCEYLRRIIFNICALLKGLLYIKVDRIIIGATDCHMFNMVFVIRKYFTGRQHNFKHNVAISLLLKIICYEKKVNI